MPGIVVLAVRLSARRQVRLHPGSRDPIYYRFTDTELYEESRLGHATLPWGEVYNWQEDKHSFYIFISLGQALIVPKTALAAADIDQLRATMKARVPRRRDNVRLCNVVIACVMLAVLAMICFSLFIGF